MSKLKEKLPKEGGFTIIEVVLVLAIAGLIFLIVFLALPQLQRSRRDTQRKSDAGRFLSAMETYAGNHNGVYPTGNAATITASFIGSNVDPAFNDPSTGLPYAWTPETTVIGATGAAGQFTYLTGRICNTAGGDGTIGATGARNIAVVWKLEQGTFCQDNQ